MSDEDLKAELERLKAENEQAMSDMPQIPSHYYDRPGCNTCWKLCQRLLPDPVRQILKG